MIRLWAIKQKNVRKMQIFAHPDSTDYANTYTLPYPKNLQAMQMFALHDSTGIWQTDVRNNYLREIGFKCANCRRVWFTVQRLKPLLFVS